MANDQEHLNSELNKANKELESLLAKHAESLIQKEKYSEDFKKQYEITDIKDLDKLIVDITADHDDMSDLLGEMGSDNKVDYAKIRDEYNQKINEFEIQQAAIAEEISETQKKQKSFQQQLEELNNRQELQENEAQKNNTPNADRIELSSSSHFKPRLSNNQIQAACDRLGKEFKLNTDQDSIFLINTKTSHPTGFKITDEKIIAVNKQPLDAQACEKMLQAGKELYGNKLVVYAPTEAEKKHMEEAARKLNIECTVTTSKEEHQRLMDEHAKEMKAPKTETKAMPQIQPTANNAENVNAKKADLPNQTVNSSKAIETTQQTNDEIDLETIESSDSSPRLNR